MDTMYEYPLDSNAIEACPCDEAIQERSARGLIYGLVFSVPLWAVLVLGVVAAA